MKTLKNLRAWVNAHPRFMLAASLLAFMGAGTAAFRSAIPFGTASSWSSAVNSDPNAVRGPWFNTNEHALTHTNTGGSGTDWQIDDIVYSVEAFGAFGNGATNDRAAIQSTIAAVCNAGGGTVYFPAHNYNVVPSGNVGLTVPCPNVRFQGAGRGVTSLTLSAIASGGLISLTGGTPTVGAPYTPACDASPAGIACNFEIYDLNLVGQQVVGGLQAYPANTPNAPGIIATGDLSNIVIKNCSFSGFDVAVRSPFSNNLPTLHASKILENLFTGLNPTNFTNLVLHVAVNVSADGTLMQGNIAKGFVVGLNIYPSANSGANGNDNRIIGNYVYEALGWDTGIYVAGPTRTTVVGNIVENPTGGTGTTISGDGCVKVGAAATLSASAAVVSDNVCNGGGIKVSDITDVSITNNAIMNANDANGCDVVIDTATSAGNPTPFLSRWIVANNQMYAPLQSAICATTANGLAPVELSIANNIITNPVVYGMRIDSVDQVSIVGNQIKENGAQSASAIAILAGTHVVVSNNTVVSANIVARGIDMAGGTATVKCSIDSNTVEGYSIPVNLETGVSNCIISDNVIRGRSGQPTDNAVQLDATTNQNLVANNDWVGYAFSDSGTHNSFQGNRTSAGFINYLDPDGLTFSTPVAGGTSTMGLALANTNAATAGTVSQWSPALELDGFGWNTGSTASQSSNWRLISDPTSGASVGGFMLIQSSINGGAWTTQGAIDSFGNYTATGSLKTTGGAVQATSINPGSSSNLNACTAAACNALVVGRSTVGLQITATAFASLPAAANGTMIYCNDCTIANPCAGAGSGAIAKRLNGVWVCN